MSSQNDKHQSNTELQKFLPRSRLLAKKAELDIQGTTMSVFDRQGNPGGSIDLDELAKLEYFNAGRMGRNLILADKKGSKFVVSTPFWANEKVIFSIIHEAAIKNKIPIDPKVANLFERIDSGTYALWWWLIYIAIGLVIAMALFFHR